MTITILCPSPLLKDDDIQSIAQGYIKKTSDKIEIPDIKVKISNNDTAELVKKKQADALLPHIQKNTTAYVIAMDERGKNLTSPQLAQKIQTIQNEGLSNFMFIIGGAYGLHPDILKHADMSLSFGSMVWPHRLVGVMLLEQLYRAQQITAGHPYHKD
jgi:23S rRNA (pseudouridine1915-N3)-methyltransferase